MNQQDRLNLIAEAHERWSQAVARSLHHRQYSSASALADAKEAEADAAFLDRVLIAIGGRVGTASRN